MFSEVIAYIIPPMRFRTIAVAGVAGILTLSACGAGSGSSSETVPADAALVVAAIEGINWDETEYATTGGSVKVAATNKSSLPHNLRLVDSTGAQLPNTFDIPSRGDVAVDTVTLAPGTYTLICTIAGHNNMRATLTVS
ncbi:MAG: hypothetical protein FD127_1816 [Acidimicrobiaceae bacterium]|nr:MAG: hypothetical protein FD127_1816 [Acidimicrobiaceae bacterium]